MNMLYTKDNLKAFIDEVDALEGGGLNSPYFYEKYKNFCYKPTIDVNQSLSPYSKEYSNQMFELHQEIIGREYDSKVDELTKFNLNEHLESPNAYGNRPPTDIALAFQRLAFAIRSTDLPLGSSILDMGCGWGLSTEFFAQMGFKVTAVDINPNFIELVNKRALRLKYKIQGHVSSFQDINLSSKYDAIVFYECFHHEQNPFTLMKKLIDLLKENGKIIFIGEPIQDIYWKNWGLRLDPLSIYCMKKFGWFESGWSIDFFMDMISKNGCVGKIYKNQDPMIGDVIVLEKNIGQFFNSESINSAGLTIEGWHQNSSFLISTGLSKLGIWIPKRSKYLNLKCGNYRGKDIHLIIVIDEITIFSGILKAGVNTISVPIEGDGLKIINFIGEKWNPNLELKNGDNRQISFHLLGYFFSMCSIPRQADIPKVLFSACAR
jgi:2-polyprenyl-3-methyl-5-hydroxy-6-metoxy-1,4-benzoquinol methylase